MQEEKIYNAAVYARLSKEDEQRGDSASIETQVEMLTRYVTGHGWNLAAVYKDDGYTGTNFDRRPAFNEMMEKVRDREINLVVVKDLSRFGRNYLEVGQYTELEFPALGCRFIAVNDNIDSLNRDSNDEIFMAFRNIFNEHYSRDISKKIRSAMNTSCRSGKFIGAFAPFGYMKSPGDRHRLIIDEPAAAIVRRIFQMRCEGEGFRRIALALNEEGVLPPREYHCRCAGKAGSPWRDNGKWSSVTVSGLLRNEAYIGNMVQHKSEVFSYKDRRMTAVPKEEWIRVENTHEPIISMDVWEQCRRMDRGTVHPRQNSMKETSLFSGLLYCADCGFAMRCQIERRRRKNGVTARYERYLCGSYSRSGHTACSTHSIPVQVLSELVLNDIWAKADEVFYHEEEIAQCLMERRQKQSRAELSAMQKSMRFLEKRVAELDRLIRSAYEDKVDGSIPAELCAELLRGYQKERAENSTRLQEIEKQQAEMQTAENEVQEWISLIRRYRDIDTLDRETLLKLIDRIEIGEAHTEDGNKVRDIKIYYKFVGYIG
nr:recombinase family protein [uncultured Acetatifactor sp.]